MAFTSYATVTDINAYLQNAVADLWGEDEDRAEDALVRAAREVNERLLGLDRFADDDIPLPVESDGKYAEVLIRLNVYHAIWLQVSSAYAGEAFERHWDWLRIAMNQTWARIEEGMYKFGGEAGDSASAEGPQIHLIRKSV